jgi:F0F1-type ATP synthase assembly protein I
MHKKGNAASMPPIDVSAYNNLFVGMVLNMSWQLAIVVIGPVVGGYVLDQRFNSSPWLVLVGLVVAILATCGILWRTVREANSRIVALQPKGGKK